MRRVLTILAFLAVCATVPLVANAGADDSHTYKIELDNAFGLVTGSEVRVAGVQAGTVSDLDVNADKRAVVTIDISGPLSTFRESATCTSQPQSLIAEYYLDCQPGQKGKVLPEGGEIPVHSKKYGNQTFITVQNDLVFNTLREPYKERLSLLINEFGTALAGNSQNLNEAIRRGAPALDQLHRALAILAKQNQTITDLDVNGDQVISQLADHKQDVVNFINSANRTSQVAATRREDLATDLHKLPGFLTELRPTLAKLGTVADANTPLLTDLNATAPQLTRLTNTLPNFNDAAEPAIRALGKASGVGKSALDRGGDEIVALRQATRKSYPASDQIANFLVSSDDPKLAVETDARAATDTGRPAPTGYTALEGLLNYAYYQTTSTNQYDKVGHLLHFTLTDAGVGPCGSYNAGPTVPSKTGGRTTNAADRAGCVSWLGPDQPDINDPLNLPPYDPSVCPNGSADPELCDSAASARKVSSNGAKPAVGSSQGTSPGKDRTPATTTPPDTGTPPAATGTTGEPATGPTGPLSPLGPLFGATGQTGATGALQGVTGTTGGDDTANQDLFNFLFGG